MTKRDDGFFLLSIVDALHDIESYTSVGHDVFMSEKMRQDAVERKFEIIGEAVKNLSESLRQKYPEISWSHMARFRDVLSHHYFGVDLEAVWNISQKDAKTALEKLQQLDEYIAAQSRIRKGG